MCHAWCHGARRSCMAVLLRPHSWGPVLLAFRPTPMPTRTACASCTCTHAHRIVTIQQQQLHVLLHRAGISRCLHTVAFSDLTLHHQILAMLWCSVCLTCARLQFNENNEGPTGIGHHMHSLGNVYWEIYPAIPLMSEKSPDTSREGIIILGI